MKKRISGYYNWACLISYFIHWRWLLRIWIICKNPFQVERIYHHWVFRENAKGARGLLVCFEATSKKLTLTHLGDYVPVCCARRKYTRSLIPMLNRICPIGLHCRRTAELRCCRYHRASCRRSCHSGAELQLLGSQSCFQTTLGCSLQRGSSSPSLRTCSPLKVEPPAWWSPASPRHMLGVQKKAKTNDSVSLPSAPEAGGSRATVQLEILLPNLQLVFIRAKREAWRSYWTRTAWFTLSRSVPSGVKKVTTLVSFVFKLR